MEPSPSNPQVAALLNQAASLCQEGKLEDALPLYRQALSLESGNFDACYCWGQALHGLKRYDEALVRYNEALAIAPGRALVHNSLGILFKELGRYEDALGSCERAISLNPDFAEAYCNRGNALGNLRRYEPALASYERAVSLKPDYAEAWYKQGLALLHLKRYEDALACYDRAISLKPDYAEVHNDRGSVLQQLKQYEEALASYDRAISVKPDYGDAYYNRGITLHHLKRYEDALASYDRAIACKPDHVDSYNNRGITFKDMKRYEEALADYDQAVSLNPEYAKAYFNRGIVFYFLKRYKDALDNFNKTISIDPDFPYAQGSRLHAMMHIGSWNEFDGCVQEINASIENGTLASAPFPMLAAPSTPEILKKCALLHVADEYLPLRRAFWQGERYNHDRIRVGYFSADFHNHPTAYLMAELIEKHDRSRFEIFAFSFSSEAEDAMRRRLKNAFDQFLDVSMRSDRSIAALAREMEIDIAVDLMGFTRDARPGIFALRPAPIQAGYLGYPGTMGAPFIDYVIADPVVIPKEQFDNYTEQVVHLPHSYQVNDSKRRIDENTPTRSALGLPETGFVFCCFNNNYKITPDVFSIWMRLLSQVSGSVLWLLESNASVQKNLCREARKRNIAPERLVFAPRIPMEEHLARHRQADLFLDTFYYNAHTTASDALWAGLPVMTRLGNTFAGRVAASLLQAIGLPELITRSREEYEALALKLATNPETLDAIKRKLADNRCTHPLFNITSFTSHIEDAYTVMWRRHQQGAATEYVYINP